MSNELSRVNGNGAAIMERVLLAGDLKNLTADERCKYYAAVCESCGLNPLTRPFEYIQLNGKLTLYARKDATDQLRNMHKVSITIPARDVAEGVYVVTARATTPDNRTDEEVGAVNIAGLKGDALANAMMKATTKAKRRVTLSICGLGLLDETELETIPNGQKTEFVEPPAKPLPETNKADPKAVAELRRLVDAAKVKQETVAGWLDAAGVKSLDEFSAEKVSKAIKWVLGYAKKQQADEASAEKSGDDPAAKYAAWVTHMEGVAQDVGCSSGALSRGIASAIKHAKLTGKEWESTNELRAQWEEALRANEGFFCDPNRKEEPANA